MNVATRKTNYQIVELCRIEVRTDVK